MNQFLNNQMPNRTGWRQAGVQRYAELLGRDFKRLTAVNLLTFLGFLPFIAGAVIAILSSSILVLLPACILGGALAGPSLACMYDAVFRSFRDAPGGFLQNYRHAWKQNWKQAVLPGIVFCLLLGFYAFMLMMVYWSTAFPGWGTIVFYLFGLVLLTMFFTVYWPLLVLFDETGKQRFHNCLLFLIRFFWKILGCSVLELLYWIALALFLPWSMILISFVGIWFILHGTGFLLYDTLNEIFHIEEQISRSFPEQVPFYEDDETWLRRKQTEGRRAHRD